MRRHAIDPISLVSGALITVLGLIFLFTAVDLSGIPTAWAWPIPLMVVGALIILLAIGRDRPRGADRSDPALDATASDRQEKEGLGGSPADPVTERPDAPAS
jgi:hypothetical protein